MLLFFAFGGLVDTLTLNREPVTRHWTQTRLFRRTLLEPVLPAHALASFTGGLTHDTCCLATRTQCKQLSNLTFQLPQTSRVRDLGLKLMGIGVAAGFRVLNFCLRSFPCLAASWRVKLEFVYDSIRSVQ